MPNIVDVSGRRSQGYTPATRASKPRQTVTTKSVSTAITMWTRLGINPSSRDGIEWAHRKSWAESSAKTTSPAMATSGVPIASIARSFECIESLPARSW